MAPGSLEFSKSQNKGHLTSWNHLPMQKCSLLDCHTKGQRHYRSEQKVTQWTVSNVRWRNVRGVVASRSWGVERTREDLIAGVAVCLPWASVSYSYWRKVMTSRKSCVLAGEGLYTCLTFWFSRWIWEAWVLFAVLLRNLKVHLLLTFQVWEVISTHLALTQTQTNGTW